MMETWPFMLGKNMDDFSYKMSRQSRWKTPMYKQDTSFTFKISIQLVWGFGSSVSNAKFPKKQPERCNSQWCTSAKHGLDSRFNTDFPPLTKLEEEKLCKFM